MKNWKINREIKFSSKFCNTFFRECSLEKNYKTRSRFLRKNQHFFRQINVFTKEVTKELISRNNFWWEREFLVFSKLWFPHCAILLYYYFFREIRISNRIRYICIFTSVELRHPFFVKSISELEIQFLREINSLNVTVLQNAITQKKKKSWNQFIENKPLISRKNVDFFF